jgi:hypothetical protein
MCTGTRYPLKTDPKIGSCPQPEFQPLELGCICCEKYEQCNDYDKFLHNQRN